MRDPYDPYGGAPPPALPHRHPDAIANCRLCDDDGYRGCQVCHHIDHAAAAQRGITACRQALANQENP